MACFQFIPEMKFRIYLFLIFVLLIGGLPALAQERVQLANNPDLTPDVIEKEPVVSLDGQTMVFVSNTGNKWKLYTASLTKNNLWESIKPITAINDYSNANGTFHSPSLNYNGTKLYFGANFENDGGGMNIYVSEKKNGIWETPIKLDKPINTDGYEGSPSITPDEKVLYFVRNNPLAENKDYLCRAIYVSYKNIKGRWSEPELLPEPINLECEECPAVSPDGKTLYFSSVRKYKDDLERESQDGYDLYYTKRIGNRIWTNPVILDSLSTDYDDLSASISASGDVLYYASGDETKKNIKKHHGSVYKRQLPQAARPKYMARFSGKVTDLETNQPVKAHLKITNPYTSELIATYENNEGTGTYDVFLPAGANYKIDVFYEGYSHSIFHYDATKIKANQQFAKDFQIYSKVNLILNVFDHQLFESLASKISIIDELKGETADSTQLKELAKGRYELTLPIGKYYKFQVSAINYNPIEYLFDMREVVQFSEYEKDLTLEIKKKEFKITVVDKETKAGVGTDVIAKNLSRRDDVLIKTLGDGNYQSVFRLGDEYELSFHPKGYSYYTTRVKIDENSEDEIQVELVPIKKEVKFILRNITFEVNSADLKEASYLELNRVFDFMNENPEVRIELSAHTDDRGTDEYNLILSERRAESVKNYLIEKGVAAERLTAKGYGEGAPMVENTSEDNRRLNRRVEMKIINVAGVGIED